MNLYSVRYEPDVVITRVNEVCCESITERRESIELEMAISGKPFIRH